MLKVGSDHSHLLHYECSFYQMIYCQSIFLTLGPGYFGGCSLIQKSLIFDIRSDQTVSYCNSMAIGVSKYMIPTLVIFLKAKFDFGFFFKQHFLIHFQPSS